jgi:hypothetical protein
LPAKRSRSAPSTTRLGHRVGGAAAHQRGDRQLGVRGDRDQVAEAAAAQRAGLGEQAHVREDGAQRGHLRAREAQRWAVGDVAV